MAGAVRRWGIHFLLCRTHGAVQKFLKAGDSFQCLAGVIEHVPGAVDIDWGIRGVEQTVAGGVVVYKTMRTAKLWIHARRTLVGKALSPASPRPLRTWSRLPGSKRGSAHHRRDAWCLMRGRADWRRAALEGA